MHVVTVIPISKKVPMASLSYVSRNLFAVGSIVSVPLKNNMLSALVVSCEPVSEAKAKIRNATFQLKTLEQKSSKTILPKKTIAAAERISSACITPLGTVLTTLLPTQILDSVIVEKQPKTVEKQNETTEYILQNTFDKRMRHHSEHIAKKRDNNQSTVLVVPTIVSGERIMSWFIKHGNINKEDIFFCNSRHTKKKQHILWNTIVTHKKPVLIVTTPGFLLIPRHDVGLYIVEHEHQSAYRPMHASSIDVRIATAEIAKTVDADIVYADTTLRIESLFNYRTTFPKNTKNTVCEQYPSAIETRLIDMVHEQKKQRDDMVAQSSSDTKHYQLLSKQLLHAIETTLTSGERVFLYTTRRGLFPITLCNDCGTMVSCNDCGKSLTIHEKNGERMFVCHHCGISRNTKEYCNACGGWHLVPLGISSAGIEALLHDLFPKTHIFRLDSDAAKTPKQAHAIAEIFEKTAGSVLVGTEMALSYLTNPVSLSAIVSIDSILALPYFRGNEMIFDTILRVRNMSPKICMVQTRNVDRAVFAWALRGDYQSLYNDEIEVRKMLGYPPFGTFILFRVRGSRHSVIAEQTELIKQFDTHNPQQFKPNAINSRMYEGHVMVHLPHATIDTTLREKLSALSRHVEVIINPEIIMHSASSHTSGESNTNHI